MKKLLPTSTAGSLPKPAWLAEPETLWSPWKLQGAELIDGKQDALRVALQEQQQAGVDSADNIEFRNIQKVNVESSNENKCTVLFDSKHSIEDKILNEQFDF